MSVVFGSRKFSAGDIVFNKDDILEDCYFIESGVIEIIHFDENGKPGKATQLGANHIFGELSLVETRKSFFTAKALTDAKINVISKSQVLDRLENTDPVIRAFAETLLQRVFTQFHNHESKILKHKFKKNKIAAIDKLKLESEIKDAIDNNKLAIKFQPIYDLKDNIIKGAEALVRWPNNPLGLESPEAFIKICEETQLIIPLGRWVIKQAIQSWKEISHIIEKTYNFSSPFVSVNLSAKQIHDEGLLDFIKTEMKRNNLKSSQLKLEITETTLINEEVAISWIEKVHKEGFSVAIDDFGSGYSSFKHLSLIPYDFIKIDTTLVTNIDSSSKDRKIIEAILKLGEALNTPTIVEGVRSKTHIDILRSLNCRFIQGYVISKPLFKEDFIKKIANKKIAA